MIEIGTEVTAVAASLTPVVIEEAGQRWHEQSLFEGLFRGGETLLRILIAGGITFCIGWFAWAGLNLPRVSDNPQALSAMRMKMAYAVIGGACCVTAFFFVGAGIEFAGTIFGREAVVDVGKVGVTEADATQTRREGEYLGVYNNASVFCKGGGSTNAPDDDQNSNDTPVQELGWTWSNANKECTK